MGCKESNQTKNNLKLKTNKCRFFRKEVTHLGHLVSENGIQDWPLPKSVKYVRIIIGFSGYYTGFVNGFSKNVRPLNDLLVGSSTKESTRMKVPFQVAFEQSFIRSRTALTVS